MTLEQRYHPLLDEWVVVAGHRQHRPWQGELQGERKLVLPSYVAWLGLARQSRGCS